MIIWHKKQKLGQDHPIIGNDLKAKLVKWVIEMSEIGYGQHTHMQVCEIVKKIYIDQTGKKTSLPDNRPGKEW